MGLEILLNEVLVETFNTILEAEENAIKKHGDADISISEMHLIEAAGKGGAEKTVSLLAQELSVTLPTVTTAIQKLEQKGYLIKSKSERDARSVIVKLTEKGQKIDEFHKRFHLQMIKTVIRQLDESEQKVLYEAISKLNSYFKMAMKLSLN